MSRFSRRQFVQRSVISAAAASAAAAAPHDPPVPRRASEAGRGVKIACSTALWRKAARVPLEQALRGVSSAGFTWVEVSSDDLWEFRERPVDFKKLLDQAGLGLVTATVFGNFADREQRLKNISRAVPTARVLQSLGAGILILEGEWGGIPREPRNYHVYSSNLGEIGALVYEETGLHCGYRFRETEAADVRKIIATSDSRYVKFCFDTGYFTELGIALPPMIQAYSNRLVHVHLRDVQKSGSGWQDTPLGSGKLDTDGVLAALCDARYDGWVTIQQDRVRTSAEKDTARSLRKVQKRLHAAAAKAPLNLDAEGHSPEMPGGVLHGLVTIGAAVSVRPSSFFGPTPQDRSNPAGQMTHDMHAHRNRPVAPLPPRDPYFAPLFFSAEEYRDVSALAEMIIPVTNSPGALDARADEYADLMIWLDQEDHETARRQAGQFRAACAARYGKDFADLTPARRIEFVTALAGGNGSPDDRLAAAFFHRIRALVIRAYYASPQGLIQELGYKGNTYVTEFQGCTHPEHRG